MRTLLFFLLPLLLFAKPFKVATYNVENLFDAHTIGTEYKEYTKKHNWTERMVDIKLNHTADVICDLDADILALQEIENQTILKQLQQRLKEVGCPYSYRAITSKKGAPIQVALLSRLPIKVSKDLEVSRAPRVRSILEAVVEVENYPLHIFVSHWKSRSREGWESKRITYAKVLKKRLERLSKEREYLLLGDFNTDYDANLYLEKRLDDTDGKTGLHHILKAAEDESGISRENQTHYTLWGELEFDQRWNTKFYGKKGTPDHIIIPYSMVDGKGIEYVNDSFKVFKRGYLFTKRGYINRWEYKKGKHRARGYSDHLPIYAYFDMKPYKENRLKDRYKREIKDIEYLYSIEELKHEIVLKDAAVVWKNGNNALIKQTSQGRGVFLYACAKGLEVGKSYDLLVRGIKSYKGLKEVTHSYILKERDDVDTDKYVLSQSDLERAVFYRQNELVKDIVGIYKNNYLYLDNQKIPIRFKKKKHTPNNGAKLKIGYAHLGYYKKIQLVVYSLEDFEVLK